MSCTGIVVFNIDTYESVFITHISTNDKEEHGERLHTQRVFVQELIEKYPPYEVAIERGFSRFNLATQAIFRVHGVLNELLYEYPQTYYAPKKVKEVVGKRGDATKKVVQQMILKKYPYIEFENEDQSDAYATGVCHLIKIHKMKWD